MRNCALIRYNTRYQPHYTIHVLLRRALTGHSFSKLRIWVVVGGRHPQLPLSLCCSCTTHSRLSMRIYPHLPTQLLAAPISLHFSAAIDIDNNSGSRCAVGWFVCWLVEWVVSCVYVPSLWYLIAFIGYILFYCYRLTGTD